MMMTKIASLIPRQELQEQCSYYRKSATNGIPKLQTTTRLWLHVLCLVLPTDDLDNL